MQRMSLYVDVLSLTTRKIIVEGEKIKGLAGNRTQATCSCEPKASIVPLDYKALHGMADRFLSCTLGLSVNVIHKNSECRRCGWDKATWVPLDLVCTVAVLCLRRFPKFVSPTQGRGNNQLVSSLPPSFLSS